MDDRPSRIVFVLFFVKIPHSACPFSFLFDCFHPVRPFWDQLLSQRTIIFKNLMILTLSFPGVTNNEFLFTSSIHSQGARSREVKDVNWWDIIQQTTKLTKTI